MKKVYEKPKVILNNMHINICSKKDNQLNETGKVKEKSTTTVKVSVHGMKI